MCTCKHTDKHTVIVSLTYSNSKELFVGVGGVSGGARRTVAAAEIPVGEG